MNIFAPNLLQMILHVSGYLLGALPLVGASPLLGALSLIGPNYSELYISELNEYFDTKSFVNDPSCL